MEQETAYQAFRRALLRFRSRSRLLREGQDPDGVWRAVWATPSGYRIHGSLDLATAERIARLNAAGVRKPDQEPAPWNPREPIEPSPPLPLWRAFLAEFAQLMLGH